MTDPGKMATEPTLALKHVRIEADRKIASDCKSDQLPGNNSNLYSPSGREQFYTDRTIVCINSKISS